MKDQQHIILFLFLWIALSVTLCKSLVAQEYFQIKKAPFNEVMYDDISPSYFEKGIIFVSNRTTPSFVGAKTDELKNVFNLFLYDTTNQRVSLLSNNLSTLGHEGPVSYCQKTRQLFFTRTQSTPRLFARHTSEGTLGIFISRFENGRWTQAEPFIWNSDEYNLAHPAISEDGELLFFSSDMEGTVGRMDIFYAKKEGNGWSSPVHLGSTINSPRNEVYPFYQQRTGKLYFSSNGLQPRIGNLDIYFCFFDGEKCSAPVLLPSPINSRQDDFAYITLDDQTGYFTSRRKRNNDNDHIYSFSVEINPLIFENCLFVKEDEYCIEVFEELQEAEKEMYTYLWEFGDGSLKEGHHVTHCYKNPGTYQIVLHVVDKLTGEKEEGVSTYPVDVMQDRKVDIQAPETAQIGASVEISGKNSRFAEKTILGYYWMINGQIVSNKRDFFHTFNTIGKQTIRLSVKTKDNDSASEQYFCEEKTITIK